MFDIGLWTKALVGSLVAGLTVAVTGLVDGSLSVGEWVAIIAAVVVELGGTSMIRNAEAGWAAYAKALFAGLVAALAVVGASIAGDGWPLSQAEWLQTVIALLVGAGLTGGIVAVAPNAARSDLVADDPR